MRLVQQRVEVRLPLRAAVARTHLFIESRFVEQLADEFLHGKQPAFRAVFFQPVKKRFCAGAQVVARSAQAASASKNEPDRCAARMEASSSNVNAPMDEHSTETSATSCRRLSITRSRLRKICTSTASK
jgi:hypothetical protein